jgi:hypothetical protein
MTSYGWSTRGLFIGSGAITVKANTLPLADVEEAWTREEAPGERTVLVP